MREHTKLKILHLSTLAIILAVALLILTQITFLHEAAHALACKMLNLHPKILDVRHTSCFGIDTVSDLSKTFYLMMPYLCDYLLLIIGFFLLKYTWVKYVLLLPFGDIFVNYLHAVKGSDFSEVFKSVSWMFGIISLILVLSMLIITICLLIFYAKILKFETLRKDFLDKYLSRWLKN